MSAPQYPDVNFIVAHLGSFADDWRVYERVIEQLVRYPNVYADTSGVSITWYRRFSVLVQKKLIFGSDGHWLHPGLELHKIELLGLPREEALILGSNVNRLIFPCAMGVQHRHQNTDSAMQYAHHSCSIIASICPADT